MQAIVIAAWLAGLLGCQDGADALPTCDTVEGSRSRPDVVSLLDRRWRAFGCQWAELHLAETTGGAYLVVWVDAGLHSRLRGEPFEVSVTLAGGDPWSGDAGAYLIEFDDSGPLVEFFTCSYFDYEPGYVYGATAGQVEVGFTPVCAADDVYGCGYEDTVVYDAEFRVSELEFVREDDGSTLRGEPFTATGSVGTRECYE